MVNKVTKNSAPLRLMVVAAHPDDAELGLGASLAVWRMHGVETMVVDLTNGEPTPFGTVKRRMKESAEATRILDLVGRRCLGFKNRELVASLEARRSLAGVIREFRPDVLFSHYWSDVHPDHVAACEITEAARFYAKLSSVKLPGDPHFVPQIFYYPSIHNRLRELPTAVLDATDGKELKLKAVAAYRSQFAENPKNREVLRRVESDGTYWGDQINAVFGEPIFARDPLGISALSLFRPRAQ